ncbi:MAG: S9 family peptidase [Muribaculaceae bacterium]|nr:S9 family peptidase [Muribaculaceae bacterium]
MKNLLKFTAMASLAGFTMACGSGQQQLNYPKAPMDESVTDNYEGLIVADPYRPLENDTAPSTLEWVKEENKLTETYLSSIPYREKIRKRLTDLNNYKKTGLLSKKKDGKYYYFENDGLKNQSVIYRTDDPSKEGEVFLDPNTLSEDGTVALQGLAMSNDGKYTAYIISRSGSDWNEIYVMDTESGQLLDDHIEWAKFTGASWKGDGFYYSSYPKPEAGKEFSNANENHQIYFHKLGTPQSQDQLVYEDKEHPLHFHSAYVPESEDYLFVTASGEGNGNSIMYKNLKSGGDWVTIEPSQDYDINIVDVTGNKMLVLTNYKAANNRLMQIDLNKPSKENWKVIIPEGNAVIKDVTPAGGRLLVQVEQDASDRLYEYDPDGLLIREITLPSYGSVAVSADKDSDEVFYSFSSFVSPSTTYSLDLKTGESKLLHQTEVGGINPEDYVTEQVFYPTSDGTKIPMFLTYKKGLEKNGQNPVYLYGYGGFNISLTPGFSANRLLWLENGGIYAQANLRGGSEYGEEWHQAGTKLNKKNVFNDFISAAEYLISNNYTSPDYLTIEGGSNGGLLVGVTVNMRPDLFKVAIPRVGVMDMMRYHLFTIGWNWANDYGRSDDSREMADYLYSYSPLHNIKNDGTPYPAILITTADHDDRVVPAHSFKYAAQLQASDTGDAPKLIRIDSKAGHGGGKPISKVIDEYTDLYSFIFNNIGVEPTSVEK